MTELTALAERLRAAAAAYYDTDALVMSDAEYDSGIEQLRIAVAQDPALAPQFADLLDAVAAGQSAGGDVEHPTMMGSLDKAPTLDALDALVGAIAGPVAVEPKLDGLAIRAAYSAGRLTLVATRGDGRSGEDVTDRVRTLVVKGLPARLSTALSVEVRGEVFMADTDFPSAQVARASLGGAPFVNSRNGAAGILRKGDAAYAGLLTFAAYDVIEADPVTASYSDRLVEVEKAGIGTARALAPWLAGGVPVTTTDDVRRAVAELAARRPVLGFPIDGIVIKADTDADRARLGMGSRTPRWSIAYKYEAETAITKVVAITTAVGRTGRLAIRVEVEPVFVGGTTITFATGHNATWMFERDVRVGDTVVIKRANDVIPYIESVVLDERPADSVSWTPPATDPNGGEWDKSTLLWRSTDPSLSVGALIRYAVSRDALDIEGIGTEIVESLVERGLVSDIADLFTLDVETLTTLPLGEGRTLGAKNAVKIAAEISRAKGSAWNRIITALGIRMTGRTMGRRIAAALPTLTLLRAADVETLAGIDGIGPKRAEAIRAGLDDLEARGVFDRLVAAGVDTGTSPDVSASGALALAGMTVVVSGSVPGYSRTTVAELIEAHGGRASSSVSATTSLLVSEPSTSSKYVKATDLGVRIVTPEEFLALLG
ncbi:NAD-dependent DNA ligase LigA [Cellulomonas sp.]|uniref:NAD-dependent DNA ligase LigA n=1 Tax=Cellulomonas sp. TaxID=40001 RepID=UPI001B1A5DA5|nr:NAD-dependent DNA ligase LigA [Cellulomonas sp.]MBO9556625.1 NAD-dependent DNA ligase LigA [Cellulomonas sp.]